METNQIQKDFSGKIAFFILAALFCTYLRVTLLVIYPFVVIASFYFFKWKLDRNAIYLLMLVFLCWIFSFRHGLYLKYNLVSFYYFLSFLLLALASPEIVENRKNYFRLFMAMLTIIGILNDIIGITQYIIKPGDDNFVGIYGRFTVSQNGLSILNGILFFYHLTRFQFERKKRSFVLMMFFIISCVMGFYGAGQIVLIAAITLTYLKPRIKNILQLIVVGSFTLVAVVLLMKFISPITLDYNVAIIRRFLTPDIKHAPRKVIAFINYFQGYIHNIVDLLFGSGPGTFNSRAAFMVGSPTYFNIEAIKSNSQPYYFKNYAYPLWNASNTGPYDGFMNQPFSSLISVLGEYGLIIAASLGFVIAKRFNYFSKLISARAKTSGVSIEGNMFRFCSMYALILIIIDNYIEYPEIIGLLLIILKLSQQQLRKAFNI